MAYLTNNIGYPSPVPETLPGIPVRPGMSRFLNSDDSHPFFNTLGAGKPEWEYELDGFAAVSGLVSGDVLSTQCSGHFEASMVPEFVGAFERYFISRIPKNAPHFIHVDFGQLDHIDRITSNVYLNSLAGLYSLYHFESCVISGASSYILRAAVNLAKSFLSFPIHMVKTARDVLPFIERFRVHRGQGSFFGQADPLAAHVEDLLAFLGSMKWHERGWQEPQEEVMNGPMASIYDALHLIKDSIDEAMDVEEVELKYQHLLTSLEEKIQALRREDQVRQEFLEDTLHDIRTPLAVLNIQLEDLVAKAMEADHTLLAGCSKTISGNIAKLSNRFSELLHFKRLETKQGLDDPQPFDWPELTQDIVLTLTPMAREKDVELSISRPKKLPMVTGDLSLIDRATENLITNSIRHSPNGSSVSLEFEASGRGVQFCVRDQGPGVPEDDIPNLFDRFRGTRKLTSRAEGTGLGLAIVRRIVELHGGEIQVKNAPGCGAEFSMMLPADGGIMGVRS